MKRTLKIVLIAFSLLIVFRGQLFRACVAYIPLERVQLPNKSAAFHSPAHQMYSTSSIEQQINQALYFTSQHLHFTTGSSSSDPIQLLQKPAANCIGYGNFFQHRLEYQLKSAGLASDFELQQWRGKLYFLGWDIHSLFKNPFWKDHDFNIILDKNNGKKMAVDATLHDYFRIRSVRLQHPDLN
ncbi:MAG: hypothetical protein F6K19_03330 [Cyanothece sp. SIO1E1]|nr:hypothetical protein [Cyanothece sp. SIO1E1]